MSSSSMLRKILFDNIAAGEVGSSENVYKI